MRQLGSFGGRTVIEPCLDECWKWSISNEQTVSLPCDSNKNMSHNLSQQKRSADCTRMPNNRRALHGTWDSWVKYQRHGPESLLNNCDTRCGRKGWTKAPRASAMFFGNIKMATKTNRELPPKPCWEQDEIKNKTPGN